MLHSGQGCERLAVRDKRIVQNGAPKQAGSIAKACWAMSRRDGAIVAWHEVPGTASPQKSRPVGYGVIRAGVRTDSMIGVTKFRMRAL